MENYQNTLSEIDENTPQDNRDIQRVEALLNALLEQYGQFALLIDNLETYQDSQSKKITDPDTQNWLQAAQNTTRHGLKLLTTSRYQLPDWPEHNIERIGKPIYTDYLAFLRQLKLPARFMVNSERQQTAYETLGANFRALHYFALATEGMTLIEEQQFLNVLAEVTHDIQINIALKELIEQCSEPQKELLHLMQVYPFSVNLSGIYRIAPVTMSVEKYLEHLLAVSLLERYWNTDIKEYEYVLPPLVSNWLEVNNTAKLDESLKQTAALYFLEQLENRTKDSWVHILNTIKLLSDSKLMPQAHRLILDWVVETLVNAAQYQELLRYWLPPLLQSDDRHIVGDALNQIGRVKSHVGEYESAIEVLKQAMEYTVNDDPDTYGSVLNNLANIQLDQGDYEKAIVNLEESLRFVRQGTDIEGEAITLNNLGQAYALMGDFENAYEYLEAALVVHHF
ncbi:tetratricopeptide repeat protein, partial [Leucothrix pacifica]